MSQNNISAALSSQLDTLSGDYAIHFENAAFTPPAGEPYLAESINPTGTIPMAIASTGSELLQGFYQVLCYAPAGLNKGAAFAGAGAVEAAFQRGDRLSYDNQEVTILRVERSAGFRSGDRFVVPLSIYYRAAQ